MSKKQYANYSSPKQNAFYPRHASDRADQLTDELEEEQVLLLYNELKTISFPDWIDWLLSARTKILRYDWLTTAERNRQHHPKPDIDTLRLHHACIYIELWRTRACQEFLDPEPDYKDMVSGHQRKILLHAAASFEEFEPLDFWTFDHHGIEDPYPFRRE